MATSSSGVGTDVLLPALLEAPHACRPLGRRQWPVPRPRPPWVRGNCRAPGRLAESRRGCRAGATLDGGRLPAALRGRPGSRHRLRRRTHPAAGAHEREEPVRPSVPLAAPLGSGGGLARICLGGPVGVAGRKSSLPAGERGLLALEAVRGLAARLAVARRVASPLADRWSHPVLALFWATTVASSVWVHSPGRVQWRAALTRARPDDGMPTGTRASGPA